MLFILLLIIPNIVYTDNIEKTLPVSIILDGFTLESWNKQFMWNKTQTIIVQHLNQFCKKDIHCDAEYGNNNIHLLNVNQHGLSSIHLNITADKPILNKNSNTIFYNYTALLTSALFQAKIDIEYLHDNQLLNTIVYSSTSNSHHNSVLNRTSRLLFILLGITLVAIVFALTIFFVQKMHTYKYSKLLKATRTSQPIPHELLNSSPSTVPLNI